MGEKVNENVFETDRLPYGVMVNVNGICYIGTLVKKKKAA